MPPPLALTLTLAFIFWLLRRDVQTSRGTTAALWIPFLWISIASSRYVSAWLSLSPTLTTPDDFLAGSPIDRAVFLLLIIAALVVVIRRPIPWGRLTTANVWLIAYVAYGCLAVVWSDYPVVALKRWIKGLGHPLMALVVLTEPDPRQAVVTLFRRYAYVLIPLSVTFIKYFPHLGRGFSPWTGEAYNTGVTTNKNALGVLCLIAGFCLVWHFFVRLKGDPNRFRTPEGLAGLLVLGMTMWLMRMANSATSMVAFVVGTAVMLLVGGRVLTPNRVTVAVIVGGAFAMTLEAMFGLSEAIILALGRDPTLTDRTRLWADLMAIPVNPLLGAGFESFWLGERAERLWSKWRWRPNQAHNGYLEIYLNLGYIGLSLLVAVFIATYQKAKALLLQWPAEGRYRLGMIAALLAYSYTEAAFKALHPLYFMLFLIAIDVRALAPQAVMARLFPRAQWQSSRRVPRKPAPTLTPQPRPRPVTRPVSSPVARPTSRGWRPTPSRAWPHRNVGFKRPN
jgi:exopolysaccharide production protein ExoQ